MKKNRTLKLASGLLILCLITTCAISTTLAKYTTGDTASDTARVAKWGVEVSTSGSLFAEDYHNTFVKEDNANMSVSSSGAIDAVANVVAPGTENPIGFQVRLSGQPEVDFQVTANSANAAKDIYLTEGDWAMMEKIHEGSLNYQSDFSNVYYKSGNTFVEATGYEEAQKDNYYKLTHAVTVAAGGYYPLKWSIDGAATDKNLTEIMSEMVADINALSGDGKFETNEALAFTRTISWAWSFNGNDNEDTILGNLMAENTATQYVVKLVGGSYTINVVAGTDYNLIASFDISVTATQVD